MTHFVGSQLTSRVFCTLHKTPTKKNSPIGIKQRTEIAKKTLKLRSQRIAKAVVDVSMLTLLTQHILVVMLVEQLAASRSLATKQSESSEL